MLSTERETEAPRKQASRNRKVAHSRITSNLFRFLLLFEIDRFWVIDVSDKNVVAKVGWGDDGSDPYYNADDYVRDIVWEVQYFDNFADVLELAEFLLDEKLIKDDRITVSNDKLCQRIDWEKSRYDLAMENLLSVRVDMLDMGEKFDYFFVKPPC